MRFAIIAFVLALSTSCATPGAYVTDNKSAWINVDEGVLWPSWSLYYCSAEKQNEPKCFRAKTNARNPYEESLGRE